MVPKYLNIRQVCIFDDYLLNLRHNLRNYLVLCIRHKFIANYDVNELRDVFGS